MAKIKDEIDESSTPEELMLNGRDTDGEGQKKKLVRMIMQYYMSIKD